MGKKKSRRNEPALTPQQREGIAWVLEMLSKEQAMDEIRTLVRKACGVLQRTRRNADEWIARLFPHAKSKHLAMRLRPLICAELVDTFKIDRRIVYEAALAAGMLNGSKTSNAKKNFNDQLSRARKEQQASGFSTNELLDHVWEGARLREAVKEFVGEWEDAKRFEPGLELGEYVERRHAASDAARMN
jgi:hypothetical protein